MSYKKENCMANFCIKQVHPERTDKVVRDIKRDLYEVFKKYKTLR